MSRIAARRHSSTVPLLAAASLIALTGCTVQPSPEIRPETFEDPDLGTVSVYEVSSGASLTPTPDATAQSVWDLFVDVVTATEIDEMVVEYDTGDAPDSETLAYVTPVGDDNSTWAFAANLAFANDEDLLRATIVHEYGHLISLSSDELEDGATTCETLDLSEGCAHEDAAIYAFHLDFWNSYGDDAPDADNDDPDLAYDFFLAHEDAFVSDYAATNVTEDFAESFMTFVLEDEPAGASPVADKLAFFWEREGEPERRDRIRSALGMD